MKTAVVLAGGHGMRLWPLTRRLPKPMVPVGGRPIMEFVVSALRASGFRNLLVILQFNPRPIIEYFGSGARFGLVINYILQDGNLGTAGCIRQAMELLPEEFVVVASDILFHGDLLDGEEFHHKKKSEATIALARVDDPSLYGVVMRGPRGRIVEFREKPSGDVSGVPKTVNAGIYFLRKKVLERVDTGMPVDFGHQLFPGLVRQKAAVFGWDLPGYWRDIGSFRELRAARRDVKRISVFKNMVTRWPASRSGERSRIWVHLNRPASEWLEMDVTTIGQAAGIIWNHLAKKREKTSTLSELQKIRGVGSNDAIAAVGWLAREGKLTFTQNGRKTKVQLNQTEASN